MQASSPAAQTGHCTYPQKVPPRRWLLSPVRAVEYAKTPYGVWLWLAVPTLAVCVDLVPYLPASTKNNKKFLREHM